MEVTPTEIPEVRLIKPQVFEDERGFFLESYSQRRYADFLGPGIQFVQDNHSRSARGVLRGLHYQIKQTQGKLVRVVWGEIFDVAVDLRKSSPTFGKHVRAQLSAQNKHQFWVPPGFAHGFLVTSEVAEVLYKTTDYYAPEHERSLLWSDPVLEIPWPLASDPTLSPRDAAGVSLASAEVFP